MEVALVADGIAALRHRVWDTPSKSFQISQRDHLRCASSTVSNSSLMQSLQLNVKPYAPAERGDDSRLTTVMRGVVGGWLVDAHKAVEAAPA
jgi:hypothetical protein